MTLHEAHLRVDRKEHVACVHLGRNAQRFLQAVLVCDDLEKCAGFLPVRDLILANVGDGEARADALPRLRVEPLADLLPVEGYDNNLLWHLLLLSFTDWPMLNSACRTV